ncbi:MAG TPA: circularly permuted type 2 ATP-grasp protein [Baekduia sp.]|nr:circularly permuted type 2 ATP-grasp protein [Baekduia sp.]
MTSGDAAGERLYVPASGTFDEAISGDGTARPHARASLAQVAATPGAAARDMATQCRDRGVVFNSYRGSEELLIDPLPRVIPAAEFALLEAGLIQRVEALDAFVDDVYGARTVIAEGVVPERVVSSADHYDPDAARHRPPGGTWIGVAGLDVVRGADGELVVLEDNVRTPSGFAYALAARELVEEQFPRLDDAELPRPIDHGLELLADTLAQAAPESAGDDPYIALLSDGPDNSAWWEHSLLSERLGIALVVADDLELAGDELRHDGSRVDVVYRRTDACSTDSWVGELLGVAVRAGTLGLVNGFGTGIGDDKLVHAYVEDLIRFFCGAEPLLSSVKTFDLMRPEQLEEVVDRCAELVIKPRGGAGGVGVVICPHADPGDVEVARQAIREEPSAFIAQELVMLSTHPTVVGDRLVPRHVDLRPFVYMGRDRDAQVVPGGLTRVAFDEGALVVNSSQNGGVKDTWVLATTGH